LALDGGRVLVRVGFKGEKLLCRLDTGADNTVFYAPFYRRFPKLFADPSGDRVLKIGGVSGAQNIPAYQLSSVDFTLAGKAVHLTQPNVLEMSVEAKGDDYLDCNIGMDALRSFGSYSIDLKHLHLGLEAAG